MAVIKGVIGVFYLLCFIPDSYSTECGAPLGVADDSIIKDDQFSAFSDTGGHKAEDGHGRLNGPKAWRPNGAAGADSAVGAWIQVTFDTLLKVTKIATQGRNPDDGMKDNEYVTQYKVRYGNHSNYEDSLMYIRNANNTADMVFTGNVDRGSTVGRALLIAVYLTRLRIEIVQCSVDGCALRFELYGCQVPVCEVLDPPIYGRVTYSGTDFTGSQTIECNEGYTSIGETSTVCTATGNEGSATWEPVITSTTCVPVCDVLNAPMNGYVTNKMTTVFTDGDMQMIECDNGFTSIGETSTECTATGNGGSATWEPDIASTTCVPVCNVLNAPMNGHVTNTMTTVFTDGDMQMIECDDGFTPMGEISTVCTDRDDGNSATWETDISSTTCVYTPTSATISPTITGTVGFNKSTGGRSNPGAVAGPVIPTGAVAGPVIPTGAVVGPVIPTGAVVGPVIGVLLIIVILIVVVLWLRKKKRETAKSTPQSGQAFDGPYELTIDRNNGPAKTQPTVVDQPDQEEYAYVDVNSANTPQNEVKPDTGDIYHDVQDKPDEYAYAYADVNAIKTADEPSDDGLVHIYAKSKHGGRPITKDKQNPAADTGDIYQAIQEDSNENEYAYADVKVDANGEPANLQEGWEDNVIYAAGNDDEGIAADKGKEGWVDNNIYATTDNDAQNAEGKSQVEGWEDNIIYGDK